MRSERPRTSFSRWLRLRSTFVLSLSKSPIRACGRTCARRAPVASSSSETRTGINTRNEMMVKKHLAKSDTAPGRRRAGDVRRLVRPDQRAPNDDLERRSSDVSRERQLGQRMACRDCAKRTGTPQTVTAQENQQRSRDDATICSEIRRRDGDVFRVRPKRCWL